MGDAPALTSLTAPVLSTAGFQTGLALFNPADSPVAGRLIFRSSGGDIVFDSGLSVAPGFSSFSFPAAESGLRLPGKGHSADFAVNLVQLPVTKGSLSLQWDQPVSALALRQKGGELLTSLPVGEGLTPPDRGSFRGPLDLKKQIGRVISNIDLTADFELDVQLDRGAEFSGNLKFPPGFHPPIARSGVTLIDRSEDHWYRGQLDELGDFRAVVPVGQYDAIIRVGDDTSIISSPTNLRHTLTDLTLDQDLTLNPVISPPPLLEVSGLVDGLDSFPLFGNLLFVKMLLFAAHAGTSTDGIAPIGDDGNFQAKLAKGTYDVGFIFTDADDLDLNGRPEMIRQLGTIFPITRLQVLDDLTELQISLPPPVSVQGELKLDGLLAESSSVIALNAPLADFPAAEMIAGPLEIPQISALVRRGDYGLTLASEIRYELFAQIPMGADSWITPPLESSGKFFLEDSTLDFSLPTPDKTSTLFGVVTDSEGNPAHGVLVHARSTGLEVAPGHEWVSGSVRTDPGGHYQLKVPPAKEYLVLFEVVSDYPQVGSSPLATAEGCEDCGRLKKQRGDRHAPP